VILVGLNHQVQKIDIFGFGSIDCSVGTGYGSARAVENVNAESKRTAIVFCVH